MDPSSLTPRWWALSQQCLLLHGFHHHQGPLSLWTSSHQAGPQLPRSETPSPLFVPSALEGAGSFLLQVILDLPHSESLVWLPSFAINYVADSCVTQLLAGIS